ncbi:exopolyphosphatase / guanosine-5'-triphosphate,3'-diphosphate pyrophosphatase [Raineyella antarctica]|uniref:Exopolyphosphatase / guanosine-5'-triphosphate,3'-diphosphate pyrophosphatase n=1 Tax=Raineyella antarctica TaxID=1577474 RepID=A0A1G6GDC8_9ACTN|nr:Ppx/GppA phosphatase family protein [Raineyella antarctica]SDB79919.1 exopolyphosphatase / guanosine-5'-triphosphate,3'-diphosphate pyrophosphatase [Raineyella antarctica]
MRAAGIDCGTNSVRLLVIEADTPQGPVRELTRQLRLVRLGEGVDATGEFSRAALARTFAALDEYAAIIREAGIAPEHLRMVATSAARDVRNLEAFTEGVRARLGVAPEVIPGRQEAALSFAGALTGLRAAGVGVTGPVLVTDVGGGSTEFALGDPDGGLGRAVSLDIGSVRLRERSMPGDPPGADELAATRAIIDAALDTSGIDFASVRDWVGVAGTVTSLMAAHLELAAYDRDRVHGARMELPALQRLAERFCASTVAELRDIPSLHPQRAEVISAGALILERISRRLSVPTLLVSETDILDGVADSALHAGGRATS